MFVNFHSSFLRRKTIEFKLAGNITFVVVAVVVVAAVLLIILSKTGLSFGLLKTNHWGVFLGKKISQP